MCFLCSCVLILHPLEEQGGNGGGDVHNKQNQFATAVAEWHCGNVATTLAVTVAVNFNYAHGS